MSESRHDEVAATRRLEVPDVNTGHPLDGGRKSVSNTFPVCNHGNATMESNCKGNRLEIVQWREFGDDEDSLSVELQPAGSEVGKQRDNFSEVWSLYR